MPVNILSRQTGLRATLRVPHAALLGAGLVVFGATAQAQTMGTAPADAKAEVRAPTAPGDVPKIEEKLDGTTATVSAGGMLSTGNSRQIATTANGSFETRFSGNAIGASVLGNYGRGAPPGEATRVTTQNVQGRLRYDRYIVRQASFFLINTGRHDRLQGIEFRYNLDPGFKYLFWQDSKGALWGEGGYDLQYDVRRDDARAILDAAKQPVLDPATNQPRLLDKTAIDHSARLFAGLRQAFNKEVTFSAGVEYLQSFVDSTRWRMNFDAVFAANVGAGLAFGVGFSGRYDHAPLPGKADFDTATTVNLIYSYSNVQEPPKPPTCPCPPPPEPTPAAVPPAAAPQPAPGTPSAPAGADPTKPPPTAPAPSAPAAPASTAP